MKPLFIITLTLFLIILQSVVFPSFSWFEQCFDLLIMDILFLSIIASRHSTIVAVIFIGCIMDSISGVPFAYHILSYLWIYIMVFAVKQLLFGQSVIFVISVSFISVIIQHLLLLLSIFINQGYDYLLKFDSSFLIKQTFWGFIFIPLGIWLINILWVRWNYIVKLMRTKRVQH